MFACYYPQGKQLASSAIGLLTCQSHYYVSQHQHHEPDSSFIRWIHGRIVKPWAPGPGHVKGPPPFGEKLFCAHKTGTHTQTPLGVYISFTNNVLDFTVELDTSAIVLGK